MLCAPLKREKKCVLCPEKATTTTTTNIESVLYIKNESFVTAFIWSHDVPQFIV
jgi:hypothetical protein